MKPELSVGIIGAGAVVRERHLPALAAQPGARVTWIADPLPEQREQVAALHGAGVRTVAEPGELLADTDVVLVATPPAAHAARTVEALEAGCHVLCEKPLALDPSECQRVVDATRDAGRVATVAFNLRHHPAAQALRAVIRKGRLGRPLTVRSCSVSQGREGTTGWVGDGTAGGDALWEIGSHHADLWRFVLGGEIVEATGSVQDDLAVLTARAGDDTLISSAIGWGVGPQNEIEVLGDRARARASFVGADPLTVIAAGLTGTEPSERLRSGARALRAGPGMVDVARRGGAFQATYAAEWAAFLDAVRGLRDNPCPVEDGLAAVEVVRMLRSACGLSGSNMSPGK